MKYSEPGEQLEIVMDFAFSVPTSAKQLIMKEVHSEWIDDWIAERHYLGYSPPGARLRFAVYHDGQCVGGMLWGRPSARFYDQYKTLELTRMYLDDICPRNSESRCLGLAARYIKKHLPDVTVLLSYSDPAYGHQGTIYKAAGWTNAGQTDGGAWKHSGNRRRNVSTSRKTRWMKNIS